MTDHQLYIIRCATCGREPDYPLLDEWYCADCWEEAAGERFEKPEEDDSYKIED